MLVQFATMCTSEYYFKRFGIFAFILPTYFLHKSLVVHGAYLFVENTERLTPCDLAENHGRKDITLYLESKMIFSVSYCSIDSFKI